MLRGTFNVVEGDIHNLRRRGSVHQAGESMGNPNLEVAMGLQIP
jgi:hypothetical protein